MTYKYIDRVGVELEGAWKKKPENLGTDISVAIDFKPELDCNHPCHCEQCLPFGYECGSIYEGEMRSYPYKSKSIHNWIVKNYPDLVNKTCGFHIHLSFKKNRYYSSLIDPKFYSTFLVEVEKWGKENVPKNHYFWKRLAGAERFCLRKFNPESQLNTLEKGDERRMHLNYCLALHGTLENRLFPMFEDSELAVKAVKWYTRFVESYLSKNLLDVSFEKIIEVEEEESNLFSILEKNQELIESLDMGSSLCV